MGDPAGWYGYQIEMPWLWTRIDAASQQSGEKHPKDPDKGGSSVNRKMTRIIALALVVVMILALVASMLVPYA